VLLGIPLGRYGRFRLRDSYPLWCAFPCASTNAVLCHSLEDRQILLNGPTTPNTQRLPAITRARFSLFRFRSPLLTESRLLSLPVGNEMFHFPTFPPHTLYIQVWVTGHDSCRVSPFGNPRITARLAAPRGLSQPPTSFIGSWCQGIHRAPLLTWPQRCSRPLCSSQGTGGPDRLYRRVRPSHRSVRAAVRRTIGPRELRSLRTQQRAYDRGAFRLPVSHLRRGCTRGAGVTPRPNWSAFHP
jgi:hypothetical protein